MILATMFVSRGVLNGKKKRFPEPGKHGGYNQSGVAKSEMAHLWAKRLRHPCRLGDPHRFRAGGKSEVAHKWAKWLRHPCRLGDPHRFRAGSKIRSGPQVGKVATSPLPSRGAPPLQSGGKNQKWPTYGQSGYITPAVSGIPTAAERGGGGGGNQKWPTSGQSGYITPAVSGIPTASERGAKSEVAHLWAKWLHHPCRLGEPHRFRWGGKSEVAHKWAKWLRHPCRLVDPHRFRAGGGGGGNQKWPTCGQSGYITPAVSGIPTDVEQGAKLEVAHKWAKWLHHPCRLGDPHRFRAGLKIRSGPQVASGQSGYFTPAVSGIPTASEQGAKSEVAHKSQVGKVAISPLPSRGSPPLQSRGQNQKWPTSGQSGDVTPAVSGIPTAAERGGNQKWPRSGQSGYICRLGDPRRFRAGAKNRSGPLVGKVATSPLPSRGSPPLQSGVKNQKWPTTGQSGYITPAVLGIPTASEQGAKSEVAHKWAKWLHHPCRLGEPHRCRAGW